MNKKILLTTIAMVMVLSLSTAYGADSVTNGGVQKTTVQGQGEFQGPPPMGEFRGHRHGDMHKMHPSKAEMEKKKAEFEKRLKLTDEQKQKIEENRKQGHEQVKPIFEQKHAKMQELRKIYKDSSLTQEQKEQKAAPYKADIKKLDEQANAYREENMKAFESVLTEKQKKEFTKIKAEQKKDMEKRRAAFEKAKKEGKHPEGFPPPFSQKND